MEQWEATNLALDRIFGVMDEAPRRRPKVPYVNLDDEEQREVIGKHCKGDTRSIAEAISDDECVLRLILAAFTAHDLSDIGRIVDKAIRDYHEPIIREVEL